MLLLALAAPASFGWFGAFVGARVRPSPDRARRPGLSCAPDRRRGRRIVDSRDPSHGIHDRSAVPQAGRCDGARRPRATAASPRHGIRVARRDCQSLPASVVDAFGDCRFRSVPELSHDRRWHDGNAGDKEPVRNGRDPDRDRRKDDRNGPGNEQQCLGILGEHETSVATGNRVRCSELHGVRCRANGRSVVEDDTQQRAVHLEPAVVFDQPELAELVHEEVHTGARGAHHLRERLL